MSSSLKQARIESGKTLEEISSYLKIRKQYLVALEEEDFSSMPAEVYVKGYLKLYSNYLGIDVNLSEKDKQESSKDIDLRNRSDTWKKQLIIISVLILIIIPIIYHLILSSE
jgi:cytoskeletal protein RodZ